MLSEEPAVLEELKQMPENSTTTESIFGTTVILGKGKSEVLWHQIF